MREIETTKASVSTTEARYRRLLEEWEQGEETANTVAARHGIAAATLRWWRSELRRRDRDRAAPVGTATLLPVRVTTPWPSPASLPTSAFEVVLNGGRRVLRIPAGFSTADVRALVEALEGGAC
jgi:transposase-like protein